MTTTTRPTITKQGAVDRDHLTHYLADLLDTSSGGDWCPNGLQVEGRAEIRHLVTGVSACQELFEQAKALRADAVLVHHGLFWEGAPMSLTGVQGRRVRALMKADINLFAYHLPLDRHEGYGNNAVAARALGLVDLQPFAEAKGMPVGVSGRFSSPVAIDDLVDRTHRLYQQEPLHFAGGDTQVGSVAVVSGGSADYIHTALDAGLDAFITGEPREWVMNLAREASIHVLTAGHYATERIGPQALGEHLREQFAIEVTFIDVPNPA